MDYFTNQSPWAIPNPPEISAEQAEEWSKQHQSPVYPPPQHPIDVGDSTLGYTGMGVHPPTSTSVFWPFSQPGGSASYYNNYFSPYPSLPVTSYSSLNGATTSAPVSQPSSSEPEIDPSLSSTPLVATHSPPLNAPSSSVASTSYHITSRPLQQPVFAINPSVLQNRPLRFPNVQSPEIDSLHNSRQSPKADLREVFKTLLTASQLTSSTTVDIIIRLLESYGPQEVPCEVRVELFSRLSVQADDRFFKGWMENETAMEITRNWLKAGATDKDGGQWKASVNPILSALGRMRFTVESLKNAKIGKIIIKLTKDSNSATRDLSLELEKKWRMLVSEGETHTANSKKPDDFQDNGATKKRRISEVSAPKQKPLAKRPAIGSSSVVRPASKKEAKVVVTPVKDVKTDSSFFSKPKAKLPSFNKKSSLSSNISTVLSKTSDNVAQPSSFDPFQDALRSMKRNVSPKAENRSTPPSSTLAQSKPLKASISNKKRVTFAPDSLLEQIKYIERAVYDDDTEDNKHGMHNLRDLDRGEGAALHASMFEELIDWFEPLLLEITEFTDRGSQSAERVVQQEREKSSLGAVYMSLSQIPDTPAEPVVVSSEEIDDEPKEMVLGDEMERVSAELQITSPPPSFSIQELLGQISVGGFGIQPSITQPHAQAVAQPSYPDPKSLPVNDDQLKLLIQNLVSNGVPDNGILYDVNRHGTQTQVSSNNVDDVDSGWSEHLQKARGRGRGLTASRGRGKRKLCSFFAEGRCRYGDSCDFAHDTA